MSEYYGVIRSEDAHLEHHGIKGQKWGVRRYGYVAKGIYQKHPEGYNYNDNRNKLSVSRKFRKGTDSNYRQELKNAPKTKSQVNKNKVKTAVGIGIAVVGTALAAYGAYKLYRHAKNGSLSQTSPLDFNGAKRINIERFEPERINIDRVEPDRVDINRLFDSLSTNGQNGAADNKKFEEAMERAREYTNDLLRRRRAG